MPKLQFTLPGRGFNRPRFPALLQFELVLGQKSQNSFDSGSHRHRRSDPNTDPEPHRAVMPAYDPRVFRANPLLPENELARAKRP
jgi:hypothetical protein